jgi:hypothetical protein
MTTEKKKLLLLQPNLYNHLFCKLQSNYQTKDETCKELIFKGETTILPGSKIVMYIDSCKYLLTETILTCLGTKLLPHWRDILAMPLGTPNVIYC